jgi:hypothetical protein
LFSFFFLLIFFASTFKPKQKKRQGKVKGKSWVMCITNDDTTRYGSKRNDVMKKKMLQEGERKQKKRK